MRVMTRDGDDMKLMLGGIISSETAENGYTQGNTKYNRNNI